MNAAELSTKSREELVAIAEKLKIKPHHKAKPETIIHQILQQPVAYQEAAMTHPADKPAVAVINNTPEQVLEAIKTYTAKEGFVAKFPDDGTWIFTYKGAEESGNLSIPLRIIKQKAESISRGRRGPPMIKSPYDSSLILSV